MSVFISYRRETGDMIAYNIYQRLVRDGYAVFFDYESMRNGLFDEQLYEHIEASDDFLLILSENALDRCISDEDWVRREIVHALKHKKNIVLVFCPKFIRPDLDTLPEIFETVLTYQGVKLVPEYLNESVDKIEKYLKTKPVKSQRKRNIAIIAAITVLVLAIGFGGIALIKGYFFNHSSGGESTAPQTAVDEGFSSVLPSSDNSTTIDHYTETVDLSDPALCYEKGNMYFFGNGVEKDYDLAFQYYSKGADLDHLDACYMTACMYYDGSTVAQDTEKAYNLFQKCIELEESQPNSAYIGYAYYMAGYLTYYGQGTTQDTEAARSYLETAESKGISEATQFLNEHYG